MTKYNVCNLIWWKDQPKKVTGTGGQAIDFVGMVPPGYDELDFLYKAPKCSCKRQRDRN